VAFGKMVGDSFAFAKEGLIGKWMKWVLLLIATILLALPLMGYQLRIFRGETPSPDVENWGTLFIDGIKYLIICIIYAIPIIIILFLTWSPLVIAEMAGNLKEMSNSQLVGLESGMLLCIVVAIIIALFEFIGIVRFARTGSMGEAFNFRAILATIGKIGWFSYIIGLIIMMVIIGIIEFICILIPVIGTLILFILIPVIVLFQARYLCLLYESAGTA